MLEYNYWENKFSTLGASWGNEPCDSAILVAQEFSQQNISSVLIPGIGYGRNTSPFLEKNIDITGIEISKSAIKIARNNKLFFPIHEGSVLDMPLSNRKYQGIFCYSLLHLFNKMERKKILESSYKQLEKNGIMYYIVASIKNEWYGRGKKIGRNYYQLEDGLKVFYYSAADIKKEFENFGLVEYREFEEPIKFLENEPTLKCFLAKCIKKL